MDQITESRVFTALASFKELQQHESDRRYKMAFNPSMKPAAAPQPAAKAAPAPQAATAGKPEPTLEQKVERMMRINEKVVEKVKELQAEVKELRAVVQAIGGSGVAVSEDPFA